MSRKKGIALSYIYTGLNTVIGLFMSAFIIQSVGQQNYGIYQAVSAFASYLILLELGTGTILNRNISLLKKDGTEQKEIQKSISTIWSITLILSFAIALVSAVFYLLLDTIYSNSLTPAQIEFGKPLFIFTIVKLIVSFYTNTLNGALIGFERYAIPKAVGIAHLLLRTALVVGLLSVYGSIYLMVIIDAILALLVFVFTYFYCKIKIKISFNPKYFDLLVFRSAIPLAVALLFQTIINMANNSVDKFVISVTMPPEHVAVYSVGMFIFMTFSSATTIPITMYMPQVAQNYRKGLRGLELTNTMIPACRLVTVIGGLILFGFVTIGRPFVRLLYGTEYIDAWLIAVIVMIPMFVNMTNGVVVNLLDITNKRLARSIILLGTTALNIGLTVWWVLQWGMIGAAVATAIATTIGQVIIINTYYQKVLDIKIVHLFFQSYKGILPSLALSCAIGFISTLLFSSDILKFFVGGFVFVLIFALCFLSFGSNAGEKNIIRKFVKRFSK